MKITYFEVFSDVNTDRILNNYRVVKYIEEIHGIALMTLTFKLCPGGLITV
jgi:hypothetical protein